MLEQAAAGGLADWKDWSEAMSEGGAKEHLREIGDHMSSNCWCGHGDIRKYGTAGSTDGSHRMIMGMPHDEDCDTSDRHVHFHMHCDDCEREIADKHQKRRE